MHLPAGVLRFHYSIHIYVEAVREFENVLLLLGLFFPAAPGVGQGRPSYAESQFEPGGAHVVVSRQ